MNVQTGMMAAAAAKRPACDTIVLGILLLAASACVRAPLRVYEGPERARDQVALIAVNAQEDSSLGYSLLGLAVGTTRAVPVLLAIDGRSINPPECTGASPVSGKRCYGKVYVEPGRHAVEVKCYLTQRGAAGSGAGWKTSNVVWHKTLEFDAEAGGTYVISGWPTSAASWAVWVTDKRADRVIAGEER